MNTLVSKNPILRFKKGRLILGFGLPLVPGINLEDLRELNSKDSWAVPIGTNLYMAKTSKNIFLTTNDPEYYGEVVIRSPEYSKKKLNNKLYPLGKKELPNNSNSNLGKKNNKISKVRSTNIPVKDLNRYISTLGDINDYRNSLTTEGLADKDTVKAFLLKLIDAGYDLGKYGADGIWGKDTQAAYEKYIASKEVAGKPASITPYINLQWDKYVADTITQPLPIQLPTVPKTYNRSQTRDLIRNIGLNPYSFSGAQRAALRHYLNGESDNTLLLTNGLELFIRRNKKGGLLVSKNPIERFKSLKRS